MTLLVLDIKLPDGITFANNEELWVRLKLLERHFAIYVISFIVIAIYWIGHHLQFHYVRYTDRRLIWINMFFVLLISFLLFATDLVGDHEDLVLPCEIYGVTLLALSGLSYLHVRYLARHRHLASQDLTPSAAGLLKRRVARFSLVPAVSMAVAFYSTRLAIYTYLLLAVAYVLPARVDEHLFAALPRGDRAKDSDRG